MIKSYLAPISNIQFPGTCLSIFYPEFEVTTQDLKCGCALSKLFAAQDTCRHHATPMLSCVTCLSRESVPSASSAPITSRIYTSPAYSLLGAAAFIRVPRTHILFSFAASSGSIVRLDITTNAAHPFELVTLCPLSSVVMQGLRARVDQVSACVQELQRSRRPTNTVDMVSEESETSDLV